MPFVAVLTPLAFQLQGVYRLRRGRSRVDDFFAVLIGTLLALGIGEAMVRIAGVAPEVAEMSARVVAASVE